VSNRVESTDQPDDGCPPTASTGFTFLPRANRRVSLLFADLRRTLVDTGPVDLRHELLILHRSVAMLRPDERALTLLAAA
jgi:hypothetical protein